MTLSLLVGGTLRLRLSASFQQHTQALLLGRNPGAPGDQHGRHEKWSNTAHCQFPNPANVRRIMITDGPAMISIVGGIVNAMLPSASLIGIRLAFSSARIT